MAPVGRQSGYLINYNSNIKDLRDQVEKLTVEKDGINEIGRYLEEVNAKSLRDWCPNLKSA